MAKEYGPRYGASETNLPNLMVQQAVQTLNEALRADPACIGSLIAVRRQCGKAIADHPHVIFAEHGEGDERRFTLGSLGILNGIFSAAGADLRVTAIVDDADNQNVLGFQIRPAASFGVNGLFEGVISYIPAE